VPSFALKTLSLLFTHRDPSEVSEMLSASIVAAGKPLPQETSRQDAAPTRILRHDVVIVPAFPLNTEP
jgi:hypothetical protein